MDVNKLTRVVIVIDGKAQEFWADSWLMFDQDEERTLKLFAQGVGNAAQKERSLELGADLAEIQREVRLGRWDHVGQQPWVQGYIDLQGEVKEIIDGCDERPGDCDRGDGGVPPVHGGADPECSEGGL